MGFRARVARDAGACGGGGDKPISFMPVSATSDGSLYTLTLGDLKMVVDASTGARITEFSLSRRRRARDRDENLNYGSTYWPSPQSSWCAAGGDCWPPPPAIDSEAYTGSIDAANEQILGLSLGLTFTRNETRLHRDPGRNRLCRAVHPSARAAGRLPAVFATTPCPILIRLTIIPAGTRTPRLTTSPTAWLRPVARPGHRTAGKSRRFS